MRGWDAFNAKNPKAVTMGPGELIQLMQASIAPFVLISGVGLLLLSMTNRLARPIDRIRELGKDLKQAEAIEAESLREQIAIFYRRARLLRLAIAFAILSILFTSTIMIVLFIGSLLGLHIVGTVEALFIATLTSLILAVAFFLADVFVTLKALKREIADWTER